MLRHVTDDPVRAVTLAWRALPALEGSPARLAAFSLAVDQPTVARSALARLSEHNGARPRLAARLAYREGRLTDAVKELEGAGGWRAARLRTSLLGELAMLEPGALSRGGTTPLHPPRTGGLRPPITPPRGDAQNPPAPRAVAEVRAAAANPRSAAKILHVVTDAL